VKKEFLGAIGTMQKPKGFAKTAHDTLFQWQLRIIRVWLLLLTRSTPSTPLFVSLLLLLLLLVITISSIVGELGGATLLKQVAHPWIVAALVWIRHRRGRQGKAPYRGCSTKGRNEDELKELTTAHTMDKDPYRGC
jgi:hypothetical protein